MAEGTRQPDGSLVLVCPVGPPAVRAGFEKLLFPGVEMGLPGWERAHSQGAGTGAEKAEGIVYAPREVNQEDQNRGVERFIRELFKEKDDDVELVLTTVTKCHLGTRRLASIQYKVEAVRGGTKTVVLEASIEVEDKKSNPRVTRSITPRSPIEPFLRATAQDTDTQRQLFDAIDRVQSQLDLLSGEHRDQERLLTNTSSASEFATGFAGMVVNKFNQFPFPPRSIWIATESRLIAARGAFKRRDFALASQQVLAASKHLSVATRRYTLWKNGLSGAAVRTEKVIAAVAIAIPVLIAAPTVAARMAPLARSIFAWSARGVRAVRAAKSVAEAEAATARGAAELQRLRVAAEGFDANVAQATTQLELATLEAEADAIATEVVEAAKIISRNLGP